MWNNAEQFLSHDKYIAPLIEKWGSCTITFKKHEDYFKHICGNIIGQQLSGRVADVIEERFIKAVGGEVTPENILKIPDHILRECGMSWGKVSYLKDLAAKTKSGELKTRILPNLPDEEIVRELVNVKGIGRWTAEMFLMFSLARPDIFPIDDLGIKKGFEKVTGKTWNKIESSKFAEKHWKPYRTVASWYLWRSLENR
jgi:DNA-3-methyladenine glycosylase II